MTTVVATFVMAPDREVAWEQVWPHADALWRNGYGFVMPPEIEPDAMPATRATLEMLSTLDVRVVIPGHGDSFTDVEPALERAFKRLIATARFLMSHGQRRIIATAGLAA